MEILHNIGIILTNWFEQWGSWGLFLFSYSEAIIQPFPVDPLMVALIASGVKPGVVLLYASLGTILGAITAYILGKILGKKVFLKLFKDHHYEYGKKFFKKWGIFAILLGAFTPIPFKAVAWMAGIFKMSFLGFLCMTILGRVSRFAMVAYGTSFIFG